MRVQSLVVMSEESQWQRQRRLTGDTERGGKFARAMVLLILLRKDWMPLGAVVGTYYMNPGESRQSSASILFEYFYYFQSKLPCIDH